MLAFVWSNNLLLLSQRKVSDPTAYEPLEWTNLETHNQSFKSIFPKGMKSKILVHVSD